VLWFLQLHVDILSFVASEEADAGDRCDPVVLATRLVNVGYRCVRAPSSVRSAVACPSLEVCSNFLLCSALRYVLVKHALWQPQEPVSLSSVHRVHLRVALGGGTGQSCFKNLSHEFLVVYGGPPMWGGPKNLEYIVDLQFKEQFRIPQSNSKYEELLLLVPDTFIGPCHRWGLGYPGPGGGWRGPRWLCPSLSVEMVAIRHEWWLLPAATACVSPAPVPAASA
jgi:hypothetical protein